MNAKQWMLTARSALAAMVLGLAAGSTIPARADDTPITILYPGAAGGAVELALRVIADSASKNLGRPIVVEPKGGANGRIAFETMANSTPNNLVLLFANNGILVTNPLVDGAKGNIQPGEDYIPIGLSLRLKLALIANPGVPFTELAGLIAYAKEHPGELKCAMVGVGSNTQLSLELLKTGAGINIVGVPYKGEAQAIPDLLSGVVSLAFASSTAKPYVDDGKAKALATTGVERWRIFPDVPTMQEAGLPNFNVAPYFGVIAPTSTPPALVAKLKDAFAKASQDPAVIAGIEKNGLDADPQSAEAFADIVKKDLTFWDPIVTQAGLKSN